MEGHEEGVEEVEAGGGFGMMEVEEGEFTAMGETAAAVFKILGSLLANLGFPSWVG